MGNENCFELAGGSEYRGFELPGVDCIYFVANFFYAVFFFSLTTREISQKCQKKTVLFFHTSHKSFEFPASCRWGEVVVPSEPPVQERIRKTAKYCTIMMIGVEPEQTERTSAACSPIKIATVAGYFLISFPFMVVIRVCFPSRTNSPLKVSRYTCRYCFHFYLHYHLIFYLRMHRLHARFLGVGLFSGVTFTAS